MYGSAYSYFNGTITTLEKRYRIPSRNTGIISVGNDISQLLVSAVLSYYAGKGHRPRWMAMGKFPQLYFRGRGIENKLTRKSSQPSTSDIVESWHITQV